MIYFTKYVHSKSIEILVFHYHELMRKTKSRKEKYFMVNNYMLNKVLDKIK